MAPTWESCSARGRGDRPVGVDSGAGPPRRPSGSRGCSGSSDDRVGGRPLAPHVHLGSKPGCGCGLFCRRRAHDAADPLHRLRPLRDHRASVWRFGRRVGGVSGTPRSSRATGLAPSPRGDCPSGPLRLPVNGVRDGATSAVRRRPTLRVQARTPDFRADQKRLWRSTGGSVKRSGAQVMHPPATAHTDGPARSAGRRHRHQHAANNTSGADRTGAEAGPEVSAGISLLLTTSLL
jgi:hypothetical protein